MVPNPIFAQKNNKIDEISVKYLFVIQTSDTMDFFAQYNTTPAEMGIDLEFKEKFEEVAPLLTAHAEATVAARESYKAWRAWKGGRTKCEFAKEEKRLKYLYEDAEHAKSKTHEALQVALMGEEAWQESKRRAQENLDEEFEQALQDDYDETFA